LGLSPVDPDPTTIVIVLRPLQERFEILTARRHSGVFFNSRADDGSVIAMCLPAESR